jgi:hypothetical protein
MTTDDDSLPPGEPVAEPEPTPSTEPPAPVAPLEQPDDGLARAQRISALQAYLAQHRDRYTPEALRRAALGAGYTETEIDLASASIAAGAAPPPVVGWTAPTPAVSINRPAVLPTIGTIVAYIAGMWALAAVVGSLSGNGSVFGIVYLVGIGLAVLGWVLLREDHPSVARGLGCGVLLIFVLPLAVFVAILGYCVITGNVIGNP